MRTGERWPVVFFLLLAATGVFLARQHVFFWDTVQLGSKHAWFYYQSNFSHLLLPQEIDSGHPPLFGMYLAVCWKLFGKSLVVSHFSMLPFLWGIVLLLFALGRHFGTSKMAWFFPLIIFADPVFTAQAVLVSPDVVLVFFFLLALWSILHQKPAWQAIAIAGLALISMRGMMTAAMLFVWQLSFDHAWRGSSCELRTGPRPLSPAHCPLPTAHRLPPALSPLFALFLKQLPIFLPGGLLAIGWLAYHYLQTGWVGYHPDSPWAPSFERMDAAGLIRNGVVLVWRLLDFGRVLVWAALLFLVWQWKKGNLLLSAEEKRKLWQAVGLLALALIFLSPTLLLYRGLSAHRYLLPVFISLSLAFYTLIVPTFALRRVKLAAGIAVLGLLGGNFWSYPHHISQGWDATLAHWPYYELRNKALEYLESENIALEQVGTAFPEIGPLKYRDLSGRETGLKPKDLPTDRYILWSNVMNDFSDAERAELKGKWQVEKQWKKRGVAVVLYRKR